jgi:hypothetical protein
MAMWSIASAIQVRGRVRMGGAGDKKVMDAPESSMPRCFLGRPLTRSPRVSRADSDLSPRAGRGKKEAAPREYFSRKGGGEQKCSACVSTCL